MRFRKRCSAQRRELRKISFGNRLIPVGSSTLSRLTLAKLSHYSLADEAALFGSQYSITWSSSSSRVNTFSGWPSQSIQA